jgi:hypothetical protein
MTNYPLFPYPQFMSVDPEAGTLTIESYEQPEDPMAMPEYRASVVIPLSALTMWPHGTEKPAEPTHVYGDAEEEAPTEPPTEDPEPTDPPTEEPSPEPEA